MHQHRYIVKKNFLDQIIEVITVILLALTYLFIFREYDTLPSRIPVHFKFSGEADLFNSRWTIWFLPLISTAIYLIICKISKMPAKLAYPVQVTKKNFQYLYKISIRTLRLLNLTQSLLFCYITYITITSAQGYTDGKNVYIILFFILIMMLITIFGVWEMNQYASKYNDHNL